MKFVISTQTLENYGAHNDVGSFAKGEHYWKFKGGDDFIVEGFDRVQDAVAYILEKKCGSDNWYKEFPIKWRMYHEWLEELDELSEDYRQFLLEKATKVEYRQGE